MQTEKGLLGTEEEEREVEDEEGEEEEDEEVGRDAADEKEATDSVPPLVRWLGRCVWRGEVGSAADSERAGN